ncbi:hypothetical protein PHYC_02397 [Phycisphaerales bacterium]|nr:hypothetical protein PHYC_02397 [Phycisphaerales bacterium]
MGPLLLAILALAQPADLPKVIYVSPAGDDLDNDGSTPAKALSTITEALLRTRHRRITDLEPGLPVRIELAAGTYFLAHTLSLSRTDRLLTIGAAPGAEVVLSGGVSLPEWQEARFDGRSVWLTHVPIDPRARPTPIRELWVNDQRRPRARHPNSGFLRIDGPSGAAPDAAWHQGSNAFVFKAADAAVWKDILRDTEVVTFTRWVDTHLTVASVDLEPRVVTFTRNNMFLLQPEDLYVLENGRVLLDEPGEWWLDPSSDTLYYLPLPGEVITDSPAIVPRLTTLLHLDGDPGAPAEGIRFEGLTFSHARWWFPPDFAATWPSAEVVGFPQAASGVPGAVLLTGAADCTFTRCTFSHLAGYGLEIRDGSRRNRVEQCTFADLGAGGVRIGEIAIPENARWATGDNTIDSCVITDGGHTHHQAVAVWIGQSSSNKIVHNRISRFDYTGISIGWTWGYGPANASWNIVEFNEICELGAHPRNAEPPLGDMAGIYTLGKQPGTIIRNNYFHDIAGRSIAWGIYFDEGSSGILACNNVVVRTTHGGFHQHYGRDNVVSNNIFAFGRDAQIWRTRREDHNSFTFERNIVLSDNDRWFAGDWSDNLILDCNIYCRLDGAPIPFPGGQDWAAWQATGRDAKSVIANPELAVTGRDWNPTGRTPATIREDSPLARIGFVPIDLSTIGPQR